MKCVDVKSETLSGEGSAEVRLQFSCKVNTGLSLDNVLGFARCKFKLQKPTQILSWISSRSF